MGSDQLWLVNRDADDRAVVTQNGDGGDSSIRPGHSRACEDPRSQPSIDLRGPCLASSAAQMNW
jgi:hypothetical protein